MADAEEPKTAPMEQAEEQHEAAAHAAVIEEPAAPAEGEAPADAETAGDAKVASEEAGQAPPPEAAAPAEEAVAASEPEPEPEPEPEAEPAAETQAYPVQSEAPPAEAEDPAESETAPTSTETPEVSAADEAAIDALVGTGAGGAQPPPSIPQGKPLTVRQYLDSTVVPVLRQGLRQLVKTRPEDPYEFLADFIKNNKPLA